MINQKTKSVYPVTVEEVKKHLRIDPDEFDDDGYIENSIIPAATRYCENFIDKDLAYTANVYTLYDFYDESLRIDEGNLVSITDVSINGTEITSYDLKEYDSYFTLDFGTYIGGDDNTLAVKFTTGYATGTCPEEIKQAILIKCGDFYDVQRSSYTLGSAKFEGIVERILMPFKTIRW